jgi:hypothetical protein
MGFHLEFLHIHLSVIIKSEVDPGRPGVRNSNFSWSLDYISEHGWDRSMSLDSALQKLYFSLLYHKYHDIRRYYIVPRILRKNRVNWLEARRMGQ